MREKLSILLPQSFHSGLYNASIWLILAFMLRFSSTFWPLCCLYFAHSGLHSASIWLILALMTGLFGSFWPLCCLYLAHCGLYAVSIWLILALMKGYIHLAHLAFILAS